MAKSINCAYLYRHIRVDTNDVFYIGIGTRDNYRRATTIVRRSQYWKNITAKTEWYAEIILDGMTIEEVSKKEIEFIKLYGRKDTGAGPLVNLTDGGYGTSGYKVTELMKVKLSLINSGKVLSKEHRKKISKANMGKFVSDESRQKMRNAKLGTTHSKETIAKRSISLKGNKGRTGMKTCDEVRAKQKAGQIMRREREALLKQSNAQT